jgi:hypothetical protein
MKHIKVEWIHNSQDDPIAIYSEIDDEQWEQRKVEIFRDGRQGFANSVEEIGGSMLGIAPWPDLKTLNAEPEFNIVEISVQEFENVWENRYADLKK